MNFINGIKNGKYEKWDENGIKRKEWYFSNDGSRDSTKMTILWYDNGQIWSQGYYKTVDTTNLRIGFHESWYKEGNKYFEGEYKNGKVISSLNISYHDNGEKRRNPGLKMVKNMVNGLNGMKMEEK